MKLTALWCAALAFCLTWFPVSPASATTTGQMYFACGPLAEKSFKADSASDLICMTYFGGVRDKALTACRTLKSMKDQSPKLKMEAEVVRQLSIGLFAAGALDDIKPAIQHFVNKIQGQPERWKFRADKAVLESIQAIAPCE